MKDRSARSQALRRYPALGFLAVAAALALILPSRLTTPRTNPSSLAEFAPVPGSSQGAGDLSAFADASSGGPGSGRGGSGAPGGGPAAGGLPGQPSRGTKRCVGKPARQTEDPLSPPCVALFDGDNGGATSRGVTRDEVTAVLHFKVGDTSRQGEMVDCLTDPAPGDLEEDVLCKAYGRYFNDRYQTYGRTVHLWAFHGASSNEDVRAETIRIDERRASFAIAATAENMRPMILEAARRRIVVATYEGLPRSLYRDQAPYVYGFRPDAEDEMRVAASFVCRRLAGRSARFSGNINDRSTTRKFGFYWDDAAAGLRDELQRQLKDQCSLDVTSKASINNVATALASLRQDGVTTLLIMGSQGQFIQGTTTAQSQGWFPEWVMPGHTQPNQFDTNRNGRLYQPAEWKNAFGITYDYRRDAVDAQPWYQAYREGCRDCAEPTSVKAPYLYDTLTMLFYGIQAAGPRLTVASLDKGLHAIPERGSADPYKPAAYFPPGNWSFVKDAAEIWWNPDGQAPGDRARGCYAMTESGRRYRAGEWPPGDAGLFERGSSAPCQGSTERG